MENKENPIIRDEALGSRARNRLRACLDLRNF